MDLDPYVIIYAPFMPFVVWAGRKIRMRYIIRQARAASMAGANN